MDIQKNMFTALLAAMLLIPGVATAVITPAHPVEPVCEAISPDGDQWFGYGDEGLGLMRWDGVTSQWFTVAGGQLQSNYVRELAVDGEGRLWIIQEAENEFDRVTTYIDNGWEHQYPEHQIRFEGVDSEGAAWISGSLVLRAQESLWFCLGRYTDSGWTLYPVETESIALDFSGENLVGLITPDNRLNFDGETWKMQDAGPPVTGDGVDYFPLGDGYVWRYKRLGGKRSTDMQPIDVVELTIIGSLMHNGHRYYRFLDGRVCRVDEYGSVVNLETDGAEQVLYDFNSCTMMNGDDCIVEIAEPYTYWMRFREQIDTAMGSLTGVYFVYDSGPHEGEGYFFADGYGLAYHVTSGQNNYSEKLTLESTSFERYAFPPHPALPLYAVKTPDGFRWFSYDYPGHGLMRWDGETAEWFTEESGHLQNDNVKYLAVDRNGSLWIANGGFTEYTSGTWDQHYQGSYVRDMGVDREGTLWAYGDFPMSELGWRYIIMCEDSVWTSFKVSMLEDDEHYLSFGGDYLVEADSPDGMIVFDGDHWLLLESDGQPANDNQHGSWWFPLAVGNEWRYRRRFSTTVNIDGTDSTVSAVIGTKTINGNQYYAMLDGSLYRSDGHDVIAYNRQSGKEGIAWDFTTCKPDRFGNWLENACYLFDGMFDSATRGRTQISIPVGDFTGYRFGSYRDFFVATSYFLAEGTGIAQYHMSTDYWPWEDWELICYSVTPPAPVGVADNSRPEAFSLTAAPNPFNPATTITFTVAAPVDTRLTVYNLAGQAVTTLLHRTLMPGEYSVVWTGSDDKGMQMASGLYFIRLENGGKVATVKATLVK